ncbi:hypothetical protein HMPREF9372_1786 [Sporosarcina newyorkensis 2681]|uniref:Uncharacterized protein n=1 Tax=Sporosarcina newyorkensis 2681 TaxID=1027292 RepID=F9DSK5_9BACL|nr:hypothetical protein HMPREF9372_1786 [Sporosarcina newyorkensis 2681]
MKKRLIKMDSFFVKYCSIFIKKFDHLSTCAVTLDVILRLL